MFRMTEDEYRQLTGKKTVKRQSKYNARRVSVDGISFDSKAEAGKEVTAKEDTMKSVMLSIKPEWCELIASGRKTIEVRKSSPKHDIPFKCYIYCTAQKHGVKDLLEIHSSKGEIHKANGKVIGEFICDRFDAITIVDTPVMEYIQVNGKASITITDDTCLAIDALSKYANGETLYGWHISNLVIYDKPKELMEFGLSRPPQSWCYVEEVRK